MKPFSRSDLSWIFELTTLVVVILGLTFAAMELRQLRSEQESQTMLQLFDTLRSDEYIRSMGLLAQLPEGLTAEQLSEKLSPDDLSMILQLQLTYEALGVMVYRRDISMDWVDELFRFGVVTSWEKLQPLTYRSRETDNYSGINEWHQWLAERLMERSDGEPVPAYEAFMDWEP